MRRKDPGYDVKVGWRGWNHVETIRDIRTKLFRHESRKRKSNEMQMQKKKERNIRKNKWKMEDGMIHPHRSSWVEAHLFTVTYETTPGYKHHTSDYKRAEWQRTLDPTQWRRDYHRKSYYSSGSRAEGVSCCKSEHPNGDDKKPTRSTAPGWGWRRKLATFSQRRLSWPVIHQPSSSLSVCVCHDEQGK
jgi:hypothetical protein